MSTKDDEITIKELLQCWGKTDRLSNNSELFHPALFHIIDVANVAKCLLDERISLRIQNVFSQIYQIDQSSLQSFLPFLIALHDIGKFSASFQRTDPIQYKRLVLEGFSFGSSHDLTHSQVGRHFIWYEWPDKYVPTISDSSRKILREMIGGHHGQYLSPGELGSIRIVLKNEEPEIWKKIRGNAFSILANLFLDPSLEIFPEPKNYSAAAAELTGFTILCDWIGSDQRFFLPKPEATLEEYLPSSIERAFTAIKNNGFSIPTSSCASTSFGTLFSNIPSPRPLQKIIDDIPDELLKHPVLIVIEAPTGEGKTEAALALAHKIGALRGTEDFYYALPTTATSNQMFLRVESYLDKQLKMMVGAKLVHGQAYLDKDFDPVNSMSNGENDHENNTSLDWFNSKKKAMLAPFGVGTIDQLELATLNVRHSSLRLLGLSGKVIILDEVHAYDTYMTTIVIRLLAWLKALGASVILLSATLPSSRRNDLVNVYSIKNTTSEEISEYPLILVTNRNAVVKFTPEEAQPSREIELQFLEFSEEENEDKAHWLLDQAKEGGCVCWITNTVNRAQSIFQALLANAPGGIELILFHSRFPLEQRDEIEKKIVTLVGPDKTERPKSAIIIGTQVLEQSLDLDFDLMVSDLAPVDLLLQRAGRLHRHSTTTRPPGLHNPILYINFPMNDNNPVITTDELVYAPYFLLRTFQAIQNRNYFHIPDDYRTLIEEVYGPLPPDASDKLKAAYQSLLLDEEHARQEAVQRLLPEPDPEELFTSVASRLTFVESETRAGWTVAQTRLGELSINIIPLEDRGEYCKLPGSEKLLPKSLPADHSQQLAMLRQQIRISHKGIAKAMIDSKEELPVLFTGSPLLHDFFPLWLHDGSTEIINGNSTFEVTIDLQLGLTITKKGG